MGEVCKTPCCLNKVLAEEQQLLEPQHVVSEQLPASRPVVSSWDSIKPDLVPAPGRDAGAAVIRLQNLKPLSCNGAHCLNEFSCNGMGKGWAGQTVPNPKGTAQKVRHLKGRMCSNALSCVSVPTREPEPLIQSVWGRQLICGSQQPACQVLGCGTNKRCKTETNTGSWVQNA